MRAYQASPFADLEACQDPTRPDPRARHEMLAFDSLPAEIRKKIAESRYDAPVAEILPLVQMHGAADRVKERLRRRGLMPCDVGTEGVIVETVALLNDNESDRLKREGFA